MCQPISLIGTVVGIASGIKYLLEDSGSRNRTYQYREPQYAPQKTYQTPSFRIRQVQNRRITSGVKLEGKVGYTVKNNGSVNLRIAKINNYDNGRTGTLKISLIKQSSFYYGGKLNGGDYDLIAQKKTSPINQGYQRTNMSYWVDEQQEGYSYRDCYTMLLEEYQSSGYKIVDWRNFD